MGTSKYLNQVAKILPAIQARQMKELLSDLQVTGQVRNVNEYKTKLQELASLINSGTPTPSFQQISALVWRLCSSDAHNQMMKSAANDIEAAFAQVDELGTKLDDHNRLFMNNLIADLENNLNEQENNILRLEWLANKNNEFTQALVNSFTSSSSLRVPRSAINSSTLYFDNRTYAIKAETELPNAIVSELGDKLILDIENDPIIRPINVKLHTDESSYGTEVHVNAVDNILNIIDGELGTFWYRDVYLNSKVEKVTTVLEFDLGLAKDIDYIVVEGASPSSFYISSIVGLAPDGHKITLLSQEEEVNGKTRIDFTRTNVRAILVTFSTETYLKAEYFVPPEAKVLEVFEEGNRFEKILQREAIAPVVKEALSPTVGTICAVSDYSSIETNYYKYTFGLDNVYFGNSQYKDTGIFVSKPLVLTNPGVVGVEVSELTTTELVKNSIEYEIVKIDTFPRHKETHFPIPSLDQEIVESERLVFTKQFDDSTINDTGALRFIPSINWFDDDLTKQKRVDVYENGLLLELGNDWEYSISSDFLGEEKKYTWYTIPDAAEDISNYLFSPPKFWIKIKNPKLTSIYTVNYTLLGSDSVGENTIWLDADKTIYLGSKGRVYIRQEDPDVKVTSELYLQITLRRNLSSQSSTPELYSYALLSASYE